MLFCNNNVNHNRLAREPKLKEEVAKTPHVQMLRNRKRHVGLAMIVISSHFPPPEAPQELDYEFTSQTCFAAHACSRLISGRNVD